MVITKEKLLFIALRRMLNQRKISLDDSTQIYFAVENFLMLENLALTLVVSHDVNNINRYCTI